MTRSVVLQGDVNVVADFHLKSQTALVPINTGNSVIGGVGIHVNIATFQTVII